MFRTAFLIFAALTALEPRVRWEGVQHENITIEMSGEDELAPSCLKSGLRLEYRFLMQLCKRRPFWFDSCLKTRQEIHGATFDPLNGTYHVKRDRLRDHEDPWHNTVSSYEEAEALLRTVHDVPLSFLAGDHEDYIHSARSYLSIRITSRCEGDDSDLSGEIQELVTLGLESVDGYDSDWVDFGMR